MKIKIIEKDILTVDRGIICQQVNCQGVMGSGLAKSIRDKWPIVYEAYSDFCNKFKNDFKLLGRVNEIDVKVDNKTGAPIIIIANIFGQLNYGYDGKRYTDYDALVKAFEYYEFANKFKMPIYFPYNFGCDRGGADWEIVSKIIAYYFPDAIICKLPK